MRGVREENQEEIKEETEEQSSETRGRKRTLKIGSEVIRAYEGKNKLPPDTIGKNGCVIKAGEPRHFLTRQGNAYKLVRVYRAKGIKYSLVRMIKPYLIQKPEEVAKGTISHKELFQKLKKAEIPGAM